MSVLLAGTLASLGEAKAAGGCGPGCHSSPRGRQRNRERFCVRGSSVAATATATTTFCDDIGDISGFDRLRTGSTRIAGLRTLGLQLAS